MGRPALSPSPGFQMHRCLSSFLAGALVVLAVVAPARAGSPSKLDARFATVAVAAGIAVNQPLGAAPSGVTDLKFRDLFKLPVGPKGLEPTAKLRRLDGKRVRIVGYMVHQQPPLAGGFLLSPLPVAAGDEDDSLADDIPANAIFISLPAHATTATPMLPGLLQVSGRLKVGAHEIPGSDRVAPARIELDAESEHALIAAIEPAATP